MSEIIYTFKCRSCGKVVMYAHNNVAWISSQLKDDCTMHSTKQHWWEEINRQVVKDAGEK